MSVYAYVRAKRVCVSYDNLSRDDIILAEQCTAAPPSGCKHVVQHTVLMTELRGSEEFVVRLKTSISLIRTRFVLSKDNVIWGEFRMTSPRGLDDWRTIRKLLIFRKTGPRTPSWTVW